MGTLRAVTRRIFDRWSPYFPADLCYSHPFHGLREEAGQDLIPQKRSGLSAGQSQGFNGKVEGVEENELSGRGEGRKGGRRHRAMISIGRRLMRDHVAIAVYSYYCGRLYVYKL